MEQLLEFLFPDTPLNEVTTLDDLGVETIGKISCLEQCPKLRTLSLNVNNIRKIEGLDRSTQIQQLILKVEHRDLINKF